MSSYTRPVLLGHVVNCLIDGGPKRGLSIRQILEKVKYLVAGNRNRGQPSTVSLVRRALKYGMNAGIIRYCNGRFRLAIDKTKAQFLFSRKFDLTEYVRKVCEEYKKKIRRRGNAQSNPERETNQPKKRPSPNTSSRTSKKSQSSLKSQTQKKIEEEKVPGRKKRIARAKLRRIRKGKSKAGIHKSKSRVRKTRKRRGRPPLKRNKSQNPNPSSPSTSKSTISTNNTSDSRSPKRSKKTKKTRSRSTIRKTRQYPLNRKSKSSRRVSQKSTDKNVGDEEQKSTNNEVDPAIKQMIMDNLESVRPTSKNKMLQRKDLTHGPTLSDFSE